MAHKAFLADRETLLERRERAVAGATLAVAALRERGVETLIVGSLVNGRFGQTSDIDFLVTRCPRALKYAIEGVVEDCLMGMAFDVVYLDEVPGHKRLGFLGKARDVSTLG